MVTVRFNQYTSVVNVHVNTSVHLTRHNVLTAFVEFLYTSRLKSSRLVSQLTNMHWEKCFWYNGVVI
jgi:hypothetical protein